MVLSRNNPFGNNALAVNRSLMYPKSLVMESLMLGNWILTATDSSLPVGETEGESTALWTCPMDAAAKGMRSNDAKFDIQSGPSDACITF